MLENRIEELETGLVKIVLIKTNPNGQGLSYQGLSVRPVGSLEQLVIERKREKHETELTTLQ